MTLSIKEMLEKPPHLRPEFSERFKDPAVARAYLARPPYPAETFEILSGLITDTPRRVLDVGCGTGSISRAISPLVDSVDAVDFSPAMVETARGLPGGDSPKIAWRVGAIESIRLSPPYSLIVGGQSLHWTDWNVVFPRFRGALTKNGCLAVVDLEWEASGWRGAVAELIEEFSTNPDYRPYDMVQVWQKSGAFDKKGERKTTSATFREKPQDFVEFLHSMSSLTRSSMGEETAKRFDEAVLNVIGAQLRDGSVEIETYATVVWGSIPL